MKPIKLVKRQTGDSLVEITDEQLSRIGELALMR